VVWFELNPRPSDGTHYSEALGDFFRSRGAIVDGKRLVWGMDEMRYRVLLDLARIETARQKKGAQG
jgi:hypothetical protein